MNLSSLTLALTLIVLSSCGKVGGFGVGRLGDPGSIDNTFGNAGKMTLETGAEDEDDLPSGGRSAVQADGKVLFGGTRKAVTGGSDDFFIARFNTDGSVDTTFGTSGKLTIDIGTSTTDTMFDLALQPDGKALLLGSNGADIALVRFTTSGELDTTFGSGGVVTTDTHSSEAGLGIALTNDAKIVAVGFSNVDMVVLRYNTDGSLDTTFSSDGTVTIDHGGGDTAWAVVVQSDDKLVVGGTNGPDFALSRLNTDGSLDTSFGNNGSVQTSVQTTDTIAALGLSLDGGVIAVGRAIENSIDSVAVARYNTDGSLDTSFGTGGLQVSTSSSDSDIPIDTVIQTDGKILVTAISNAANFNVVRYETDGSLDTTFSSDGVISADFSGTAAFSSGLALQSDGKFVVSGYVWINSEGAYGAGLARFWQ